MESLISGGAILAFFCAFVIYKKPDKKVADRLLCLLLLVLTINYLVNIFRIWDARNFAPNVIGTSAALIFVYGPLIYLYILSFTGRKKITIKNSFQHFIPFLIYEVFNIYYFTSDNFREQNYLEHAYLNHHFFYFYLVTILKGLHPLIYLAITLNITLHHSSYMKKNYSFDSIHMNLKWMRYLVVSMSVLAIIAVILNVFRVGKPETIFHLAGEIVMASATIWIFTIGYYGFKKTPVFINIKSNEKPAAQEKYQKTKIENNYADEIRKALLKKMEEEKPFLNPKLNIAELAEEINYPSYQISQVLNDKMGMTFFDFVNNYRIQEIKSRMRQENFEQLTLLGNALESGFNSKASFNRIFKKSVGMTPSEYYKKYHN